jgi:hypothetical protein
MTKIPNEKTELRKLNFGIWSLNFGACLVFGAWNLEFFSPLK